MTALTYRVDGLKYATDFLAKELPGKMGAATIARGLRLAAKPLRDAARANAAGLGGSGALAMSIQVWRTRRNMKPCGSLDCRITSF